MLLLHLLGEHIIMGAARFGFQQQQIIFRYMWGLYRPSIWVKISCLSKYVWAKYTVIFAACDEMWQIHKIHIYNFFCNYTHIKGTFKSQTIDWKRWEGGLHGGKHGPTNTMGESMGPPWCCACGTHEGEGRAYMPPLIMLPDGSTHDQHYWVGPIWDTPLALRVLCFYMCSCSQFCCFSFDI